MKSIRRFLLGSLLLSSSLIVAAAAYWTYRAVASETARLLDAQLLDSAYVLRRLVLLNGYEHLLPPDPKLSEEGQVLDEPLPFMHRQYVVRRVFQIWSLDHRLLMKSSNAPDQPLTTLHNRFTDVDIGNERWRVFSLNAPDMGLEIQVGLAENIRQNLVTTVALNHIIPIVLLYPFFAIFIWITVGSALSQIKQVTDELRHRRAPEELTPVQLKAQVPMEIQPLVTELNSLFLRLQQVFEQQQRFSADAAHELRTPLAAIKTHSQVGLRAQQIEAKDNTLKKIQIGVDRCAHIVEQLLILGRLQSGLHYINNPESITLNQIILEEIQDLKRLADEKQTQLIAHLPENTTQTSFIGNATAIHILTRNLIDNAIRYTPAGGLVEVRQYSNPYHVILEVADHGEGIPAELRERVFERFYRQLGTQASGSGLGLSIVLQIVELHRAQVELSDTPDTGGLTIKVYFPVTAAV